MFDFDAFAEAAITGLGKGRSGRSLVWRGWSPQHIAAAWARVLRLPSKEVGCDRHVHDQILSHSQGFIRDTSKKGLTIIWKAICREMNQPLLFNIEVELLSAPRRTSDRPFGSVGIVGMYRPPARTDCQCDCDE